MALDWHRTGTQGLLTFAFIAASTWYLARPTPIVATSAKTQQDQAQDIKTAREHYQRAKQSSWQIEICVSATEVANAYLRAGYLDNGHDWKAIEVAECHGTGMSDS